VKPLKPENSLSFVINHTNHNYTFLKKVMVPISQQAAYRDDAAKFLPYSLRAMQGTLAKTGGIAISLNVALQP
jgi:hypothetical protein